MTGTHARWLDEAQERARDVLAPAVLRYIAEGAREEVTLGEAEAAWRAVRLLPHVLRDVCTIDTTADLLGTTSPLPLGIAPMSLQRAAHPDGEVAMARAAAEVGVPLVLSSNAGSTFADVAATGVTWWMQLYASPDRDLTAGLLEDAVTHGASAIVLTVDTPVVGTRYPAPEGGSVWDVADRSWVGVNARTPPVGVSPKDRDKAMDLVPEDLGRFSEMTGLPVVAKGVLRGDDAARAVDAGAAAVWVSNHGGRQLDQVASTASCLPQVVDAVAGRAPVFVDGGVRSGLHAMVALALGATGVFVGRPMFYALASDGVDGVRRALLELGTELEESMRLAGAASAADLAGVVSGPNPPDLR